MCCCLSMLAKHFSENIVMVFGPLSPFCVSVFLLPFSLFLLSLCFCLCFFLAPMGLISSLP
jgi:hypothetical protein